MLHLPQYLNKVDKMKYYAKKKKIDLPQYLNKVDKMKYYSKKKKEKK